MYKLYRTDNYYFNTMYYYQIQNNSILKNTTNPFRLELEEFNNNLGKSVDYNIIGTVPLHNESHVNIINMVIYAKRELISPVLNIIYCDKNTTDTTNKEIEDLVFHRFNYQIGINIERSSIKSINLYNVIKILSKNELDISNIIINHNPKFYGFVINLETDYDSSYFKYQYKLKFTNIANIKSSFLKLSENINNIIDFEKINKIKNKKLIGSLFKNFIVTRKIIIGMSDILNEKKLATLDIYDFLQFTNSKDWTNEFTKFKEVLSENVILAPGNVDKYKLFGKTLNIKGIQIYIKDNISFSYPITITASSMNGEEKLKFLFILLKYTNKYDSFLNAICLVKLKNLSYS